MVTTRVDGMMKNNELAGGGVCVFYPLNGSNTSDLDKPDINFNQNDLQLLTIIFQKEALELR